jgi:OmpA-OmpF porin, OOP family
MSFNTGTTMQTLRRSFQLGAAAVALLGAALAAPGAFAQAPAATMTKGAYVFGDIGANWLRDAHTNGVNTTYSYDTGWAGVAGGGWGFGNGIRLEGELGHRGSDVSNTGGDATATTFMANALYDFDTGTPFTPYVGVGTGLAHVRFHNVGVPGTSNSINDDDNVWAYQGIVGGTYQLRDHWKIDANYRYLGTERPDFTAANDTSAESHYRDHALLVGVRYEFGP